MPTARIFQRLRSSTQSGRARTGQWMLEFEREGAQRPDPLTGWAGSRDTRSQVKLSFETVDAALAYAKREGLDTHVVQGGEAKLRIQAYADNFG